MFANKHVVGVYDSKQAAILEIQKLRRLGYRQSDISIVAKEQTAADSITYRTGVDSENLWDGAEENQKDEKSFSEWFASLFEDEKVENGTSSPLLHLGIKEEEVPFYEQKVNAGKILVLANSESAPAIETEGKTISTGTNFKQTELDSDKTTSLSNSSEQTIQLKEEVLNVSKERIQSGEVELHKEVIEEQQTMQIPVTKEEVFVEHRPVDGSLDSGHIDDDDELIRVPIVEEKIKVTKEQVVTGEVVIGKREIQEMQQITESVKREELHVSKNGNFSINEKK